MRITPVRLIIGIVGLTMLLCVGGIIVLAVNKQPAPDVLQNLALASLTGLLGLLVPARGEPQPQAK